MLTTDYSSPVKHRDGGLKREKVKDVFKEEQQKLYSKVLVGNGEDRSRSWAPPRCLVIQTELIKARD